MMKLGFRSKLIFLTTSAIVITSFSTAYIPYQKAKRDLETQLAKELIPVVSTASIAIDGDEHEDIYFDLETGLEGRETFEKIRTQLVAIADINKLTRHQGLSPIYTLRPSYMKGNEHLLEFVVMTNRNAEGEFFSGALIERIPIHDVVFKGKVAHTSVYQDSEGHWITAAAPLRDSQGDVVAIVQADRPVAFYLDHLAEIRKLYILGGLAGVFLGLVLSIIFSTRVVQPIRRLLEASRSFSGGDYQHRINESRHDELGELFASFDDMAQSIADANTELRNRAKDLRATALFALLNPAPVMRAYRDGTIDRANEASTKIFSEDDKLVCERAIEKVFPELAPENLAEIIDQDKIVNISKKLKNDWYQFSVKGVSQYGFVNIYGANVTERIHAEEAAKKALEAAESASKAKSLFLATMSHELRTPMNAIIGFTTMACRQELSPVVASHLQKVSNASKALLELINNILDFSKIDSGNMEIELSDFDIRDCLNETIDMFSNLSREKSLDLFLRLDKAIPREIKGDQLRVKQILINLINNALKFTHEGAIVVDCYLDNDEQAIFFDVRDTGIGIAADKIDSLFNPFVQADNSTTRKYGGTGLGLSISHRLAKIMGGELKIESTVGEGSRFYFSIPLQSDVEQEDDCAVKLSTEPPVELGVNEARSKRYLYIDDCALAVNCVQTLLADLDSEFVSCPSFSEASALYFYNGEQGMEAPQKTFDALIVNIKVEGSEFHTLCEQLGSAVANSALPILFLSPFTAQETVLPQTRFHYTICEKPLKQHAFYYALEQLFVLKEDGGEDVEPSEYEEVFDLGGMRILIAEDDFINQELILCFMEDANAQAEVTSHGLEAIEALENNDYEIVLMDMQMPVMDGYSACKAIRAQEKWRTLPIIAVTANALAGDVEKCLAAGASDFVSKPIDYTTLYKVIKKWVSINASH